MRSDGAAVRVVTVPPWSARLILSTTQNDVEEDARPSLVLSALFGQGAQPTTVEAISAYDPRTGMVTGMMCPCQPRQGDANR